MFVQSFVSIIDHRFVGEKLFTSIHNMYLHNLADIVPLRETRDDPNQNAKLGLLAVAFASLLIIFVLLVLLVLLFFILFVVIVISI
jgi:hypothetical protein